LISIQRNAPRRHLPSRGQRALPRRDVTLYDHSMRVSAVRVRYGYTDEAQRDRATDGTPTAESSLTNSLDCINLSSETPSLTMNTINLERLKEQEDAATKIIDSWPRIFQLLVYRQLYAFGIRISNIDSEIDKELKKSDASSH
jgi:hypothetical protein